MPPAIPIRLTVSNLGTGKLWRGRLGLFLQPEQLPPRVIHHDTCFLVRWWHSKKFEFVQEVDRSGVPIGPRLRD